MIGHDVVKYIEERFSLVLLGKFTRDSSLSKLYDYKEVLVFTIYGVSNFKLEQCKIVQEVLINYFNLYFDVQIADYPISVIKYNLGSNFIEYTR